MRNFTLSAAVLLICSTHLFSQERNNAILSQEKNVDIHYQAYKTLGLQHDITFTDDPYNHNMHIASDGSYYYTINGGNNSNGKINKYDLNGVFIQTYPIQIDGRGLSFNTADNYFYVSTYLGDIVKITNLTTGAFTTLHSGIMQNEQASFALSMDGTKFYDFFQGTLLVHDLATGSLIKTITGLSYGPNSVGGNAAIAIDLQHLYTWDATNQTVFVYDTTGTLLKTMALNFGNYGFSLSTANGHLFVSVDGNYSVGTWYGYLLSNITSIDEPGKIVEAALFPNPSAGMLQLHSNSTISVVDIYALTGEIIYHSDRKLNIAEINLTHQPSGVYFYRLTDVDGKMYSGKILLQTD